MLKRSIAILRGALGFVLMLGVVLNCINTGMRWLAGGNIVWAEEILAYGMILIIMAGTVIVTSTDQHLRMDVFVEKLPITAQRWLKLLSHLVLASISAFLAFQSWVVVSMMFRMGQASVAARLPMWIPHSIFLVSFFLCALLALFMAMGTFRELMQAEDKALGGCLE